jgi:hypothetical protein
MWPSGGNVRKLRCQECRSRVSAVRHPRIGCTSAVVHGFQIGPWGGMEPGVAIRAADRPCPAQYVVPRACATKLLLHDERRPRTQQSRAGSVFQRMCMRSVGQTQQECEPAGAACPSGPDRCCVPSHRDAHAGLEKCLVAPCQRLAGTFSRSCTSVVFGVTGQLLRMRPAEPGKPVLPHPAVCAWVSVSADSRRRPATNTITSPATAPTMLLAQPCCAPAGRAASRRRW